MSKKLYQEEEKIEYKPLSRGSFALWIIFALVVPPAGYIMGYRMAYTRADKGERARALILISCAVVTTMVALFQSLVQALRPDMIK